MADALPTPEGMQDSLKALGFGSAGGFKGLTTVKNEETGTIYGVIAKAKGLTLSLSPRIDARFDVPFIGVFVRVRAQKEEEWANLDDAGSLFGISELAQKSESHASVEFFTVVAAHPCTPYECAQIIANNKIFENTLDLIASRVEKAGCKMLAEKLVILDYMLEQVKDTLPSEPTKHPKEFPILIGGTAIVNYMHKLAVEFGYIKKKAKAAPKPPAPPAAKPE